MNRQNKERLIDTKSLLMDARWEGDGQMSRRVEGVKKHKLVAAE